MSTHDGGREDRLQATRSSCARIGRWTAGAPSARAACLCTDNTNYVAATGRSTAASEAPPAPSATRQSLLRSLRHHPSLASPGSARTGRDYDAGERIGATCGPGTRGGKREGREGDCVGGRNGGGGIRGEVVRGREHQVSGRRHMEINTVTALTKHCNGFGQLH